MIGAIAGDIIGSVHEWAETKTKNFPLFIDKCEFTDDTVLTLAVAEHILLGEDLIDLFHMSVDLYPHCGYGDAFYEWAVSKNRSPYNSWGNGSAMRVSPIGFAYNSIEEVMHFAKTSAEITHNHPEGIKGAQATAIAIYLARNKWDKNAIKNYIVQHFGYSLDEKLDTIRIDYRFDVSCQGSVPQAIIAFLESDSYEDAIRNAISLGGDADTMACITGGIAEAFYGGVPEDIVSQAMDLLSEPLKAVLIDFEERYSLKN